MEANPVFTTIPDIYAFTHGGRGIRIHTDTMLGYVTVLVWVRILRLSWFLNWLFFQSGTP